MAYEEVSSAHSVALASALLTSPEPDDAQTEADVIVVGAGPGGSATAAFLAQRGLSVLVLEKSGFPREKVCGDGLTPRAVRMLTRLGIDREEMSTWPRNLGLRVYAGADFQMELPWPQLADFPDYGLVCPRSRLDDVLAGHAIKLGATILTGVTVTQALFDGDRVVGVADDKGREYRAPVVVAADGNSSRLSLSAGRHPLRERPMGVAVRAYFHSPRATEPWMESWLDLRDGREGHSEQLPGYGWSFPMGSVSAVDGSEGLCNVGLGMLNSSPAFGHTDYRQLMRTWLANTPPQWQFNEEHQVGKISSAALPMAFNRKPAYADGLLLVGDAGGMVNPFNGEGISYAMEAGEMAADAIAEAYARGIGTSAAERALAGYPQRLSSQFGGYYRLGTVFVKLIGNPRFLRLCTTYGLPRRRLMELVNKLLANLTDQQRGNAMDRIINSLSSLVPPV